MERFRIILISIFIVFVFGGCDSFRVWFAQEFMQDRIADGLARLSTQHMSMIVSELNKKFSDPNVSVQIKKSNGKEFPLDYGRGEVTWTLKNVDIDHPVDTEVYSDCLDGKAIWQGKAHIVSATRTMSGRLTNDPKEPVIPDPDTIRIDVHARVENLNIRFLGKPGYLIIKEGELTFSAIPRLAQSQKGEAAGMRAVKTSNARFEKIRLKNIKAMLMSHEINMPVTIEDSDFYIQVGIGDIEENVLSGKITVFGHSRTVPTDGKGLDPNYNSEEFVKTFVCAEELNGKVSYDHEPVETRLATPVAGFTSLAMGIVAKRLESDRRCGMASQDVLRNTIITAPPGKHGQAKNKVREPCLIDLEDFQTEPDCFGRAHIFSGSARVFEAEKRVSGLIVATKAAHLDAVREYLNTDPSATSLKRAPSAVIPAKSQPAEVELKVGFQGVSVKEICLSSGNLSHPYHCKNPNNPNKRDPVTFRIGSGQAKAHFKPVLAKQMDEKNPEIGFCSVEVPVSEVKLTLTGIKSSIKTGSTDIKVHAEGDVEIVSGKIGSRENEIKGKLKIGNVLVAFNDRNRTLDPSYDRRVFEDSFLSCQQISMPPNDDYCKAERGLAANIARLVILNAGSVLKLASSRDLAGSFASREALDGLELRNSRTRLVMRAELPLVDLNAVENVPLRSFEDCLGNRTVMAGTVRNFRGEMIRDGIPIDEPIMIRGLNLNLLTHRYAQAARAFLTNSQEICVRPTKPDSTTITVTTLVEDFHAQYSRHGHSSPEPHLFLKQGTLKIVVHPYMGVDDRTTNNRTLPASYSIPTPIANFKEVILERAMISLHAPGITVPFYVEKADIKAFNGRYLGRGNYIEGKIKFVPISSFDEVPVHSLPEITIANQPLVPKFDGPFDQQLFDQSYVCTDNLLAVLPGDP